MDAALDSVKREMSHSSVAGRCFQPLLREHFLSLHDGNSKSDQC